MSTISIRLTLASAKAELIQQHLEGLTTSPDATPELRAVAGHVAGAIKKARGTRAQAHKAGDMWNHERQKGGDAVFQPMFVRRVAVTEGGTILTMSDGEDWSEAELQQNGWKRRRK